MEKKFEDAMKLLAATNQKSHNQNDLESGLSEDTTNGDVEFLGTKKTMFVTQAICKQTIRTLARLPIPMTKILRICQ